MNTRTHLHDLCARPRSHNVLTEVHEHLDKIQRECSTSEELKSYIDKPEPVYGATALHFAIERRHTDVAALLLNKGAAFNVRLRYERTGEDQGDTALHIACSNRYTSLVQKMYSIDNQCIEWGGYTDATPLIMACAHGQAEVVDFLLTIPEQCMPTY